MKGRGHSIQTWSLAFTLACLEAEWSVRLCPVELGARGCVGSLKIRSAWDMGTLDKAAQVLSEEAEKASLWLWQGQRNNPGEQETPGVAGSRPSSLPCHLKMFGERGETSMNGGPQPMTLQLTKEAPAEVANRMLTNLQPKRSVTIFIVVSSCLYKFRSTVRDSCKRLLIFELNDQSNDTPPFRASETM